MSATRLGDQKHDDDFFYTFFCSVCNRGFADSPQLLAHERADHASQACGQCPRIFQSSGELQNHMKEAHQKAHCPQCRKDFKSDESLRQHNRSVHGFVDTPLPPPPPPVHTVLELASRPESVTVNPIEKKDLPHTCHVCQKVLKNRHSLDQHYSAAHAGYATRAPVPGDISHSCDDD